MLKRLTKIGAFSCSALALKSFHENQRNVKLKQIKSPFLLHAEEEKKKSQECVLGDRIS